MKKRIYLFSKNKYLIILLRLVLGGIFILSGLLKIFEPREEFIEVLFKFNLLPEFLITPFAIILPWIELLGGIFTILNIWAGVGLIMFIGAIVINILRGNNLEDCGCFGGSWRIFGENPYEVLSRDFPLLAISLWLLYLQEQKEKWFKFFKKITNKILP